MQQSNRHRVENRSNAQNRSSREGEGPPRPVAATTGWPWLSPRSVVSTTAQPWWPLAWRLFFAPRTKRFAFCLFRGLLVLGYLHWALWSCFLPLMLKLDIKSHIPHKTWPETLKSARKLDKAKPSVFGEIVDKMQINAN